MRTIIAGSRSISDYSLVEEAVGESGFGVTVVISGTAAGVDRLGERFARERNIPLVRMPPNGHPLWRNTRMAECADALIAVWDGTSRGTADMIAKANRRGLAVYVKAASPQRSDPLYN